MGERKFMILPASVPEYLHHGNSRKLPADPEKNDNTFLLA
jgi:hypothetical protein